METNNIYINQVGYLTNSNKYFITTLDHYSFKIVDQDQVYFSGDIEVQKKADNITGENLYIGDFSDFNRPGKYQIEINGEKSYSFEIGENLYLGVLDDVINSYYFQRCGVKLDKNRVGEFEREACHMDQTPFHPELGLDGGKDVTGGWHDAGDYGRYITPGAITVTFMLIGYEHYKEKYKNSSILDEVKYELDWMLKMQEMDHANKMYGALHYMINSSTYTWDTPDRDNNPQYIMDYSSIATADFAAAMACASRVFKDIDSEYSKLLLERAELAWDFVEKFPNYPEGGFRRPDDIKTGGYATNPKDNILKESDKLWPTVELFLATGKDKYNEICSNLFKTVNLEKSQSWNNKTGLAEIQYALTKEPFIDSCLQNDIQIGLINRSNKYLEIHNNDSFKTIFVHGDYQWGSNGTLMSKALELITCYLISGIKKYKEVALSQLNYVLGLNCLDICFIAGIGSNYVKNIHHASFDNDGIDHSFKGMLSGGPNAFQFGEEELLDKALVKKCPDGTPPAKCFIDDKESFSSNENCICYSAPLVSVVGFFV